MRNTDAATRFGLLTLFCVLSAVGGCRKNVALGPPVDGASPAKGSVTYTFSGADSKITIVGAESSGERGGFLDRFTGSVGVNGVNTRVQSLALDIDLTSLRTEDPTLTASWKSTSGLSVATYPRARFVSTSVTMGGLMGATNTVTGNLDLHGVTRLIAIPATIHQQAAAVDIDAQMTVKRRDFGLAPTPSADVAGDDIVVNLDLHAAGPS